MTIPQTKPEQSGTGLAWSIRRLFPVVLGLAVALSVGLWFFLPVALDAGREKTSPPAKEVETGGLWFDDATAEAGIGFQHFDSATARHLIHETLGALEQRFHFLHIVHEDFLLLHKPLGLVR